MGIAIHLFRQDLRLSDNPALCEAVKSGSVLPIYILDDSDPMGAASRVWLYHALKSLNQSLDGQLVITQGDTETIIMDIIEKLNVSHIFWNRCYEPWRIAQDKALFKRLKERHITIKTHNASLLIEPWDSCKDDGTPYRVFTPFYKKNYRDASPRWPLDAPESITYAKHSLTGASIDSLKLIPNKPWAQQITDGYTISEEGAKERLYDFIDHHMNHYKQGRDFPASGHTSQLSSYLHFGQISPNQVWHSVDFYERNDSIENFCVELAWREFSYNLLYHFPTLPHKNLQTKFDRFPWQANHTFLKKWQMGQTGYPIVDAGMRQLWQTGLMHNRVRMIVGSFLVKNLLIDWRQGAQWFWDCLFDADLANNSAGWQWIAGCGADAAPYFRIFNPITQGQRFDPDGDYTRSFVPELAKLPSRYLFNPWDAPESVLKDAGITLGENYPMPIIDIASSRSAALSAYDAIK